MLDAEPQIATRHHTHAEQVRAACRVWAGCGEALIAELDPSPRTDALRALAADLRRAGDGTEGSVLRLVPRAVSD